MIDGLTLDYTHARVAARLSQRPDDRLWTQLRSSRSVPALLELVRASTAAPIVSGVPAGGTADEVELAFRQQLRTRIAEVATWAPAEWRSAVLYTRHLIDLPALRHLLSDEAPPRWIAADPVLAPYAQPVPAQRRAALAEGPLATLATAIEEDGEAGRPSASLSRVLQKLRAGAGLHRLLDAWESEWRRRWPFTDADERSALERLVQVVRSHLARFGSVPLDDAAAARQMLGARLAAMVRRHAVQPVSLFAYLALFAVDLEHLRAEFVLRARPTGRSA